MYPVHNNGTYETSTLLLYWRSKSQQRINIKKLHNKTILSLDIETPMLDIMKLDARSRLTIVPMDNKNT